MNKNNRVVMLLVDKQVRRLPYSIAMSFYKNDDIFMKDMKWYTYNIDTLLDIQLISHSITADQYDYLILNKGETYILKALEEFDVIDKVEAGWLTGIYPSGKNISLISDIDNSYYDYEAF